MAKLCEHGEFNCARCMSQLILRTGKWHKPLTERQGLIVRRALEFYADHIEELWLDTLDPEAAFYPEGFIDLDNDEKFVEEVRELYSEFDGAREAKV